MLVYTRATTRYYRPLELKSLAHRVFSGSRCPAVRLLYFFSSVAQFTTTVIGGRAFDDGRTDEQKSLAVVRDGVLAGIKVRRKRSMAPMYR